jgi:PleD family two-component response regulator
MSKLILLIDDDEDEEYIFKQALNEASTSCKCIYIPNAERAIEVLNTVLPDFIFIDINMPKMDGLECLSKIKKIKKLENVPMIVYSTGSDNVIKNKALKLGAADCITKTTSIASLTEILKTILFVNNYAKTGIG